MDSGHTLKIGDYVTLRHSKPQEGWLRSEGMLSDGITLSKNEDNFENCIWEVHVQNQYTAVKEYEEYLFAELYADGNSRNESFRSAVSHIFSSEQLGKAAANEERMNEKLMALKVGKPVTYGDVIQLRHVKSNKFLTVSPTLALAKDERVNLQISLERYGDTLSWLEIIPVAVSDTDNQQIADNTAVKLAVHERPMEYIHCASRPNSTGAAYEVNCSLTSSSWTISVFKAAETPPSAVVVHNIITLHAPDSAAYLTVSTIGAEPSIIFSDKLQVLSTLGVSAEFRVGTSALWMIEKNRANEGGLLTFASTPSTTTGIKLRHLNTGLYMTVGESGMLGLAKGRQDCSSFDMSLLHHKSEEGVASLYSGAHVTIGSGRYWLRRSAEVKVGMRLSIAFAGGTASALPLCSTTEDKTHASPLVITTGLYHSIHEDIFLGIASVSYLREFQSAIRVFKQSDGDMSKLDKYVSSLLDVLNAIHESIDRDTANKLPDLDSLAKAATAGSDELLVRRTLRQMMLNEQGVLNAIIDIIELCRIGYFADIPYDIVGGEDHKIGHMGSVKTPALAAHKRKSSIKILHTDVVSQTVSKEREMIRKSLMRSATSDLLRGRKSAKQVDSEEEDGEDKYDEDDEEDENDDGDTLPEMGVLVSKKRSKGVESKANMLTLEVSRLCFRILLLAIKDNQINQIHIADRFPVILSQVW